MNWKRGLYRVWIIGSIIWIGYWLWHIVLVCRVAYPSDRPRLCQNPDYGDWATWFILAIYCLSGPLIALAIGRIVGWVVRGFR